MQIRIDHDKWHLEGVDKAVGGSETKTMQDTVFLVPIPGVHHPLNLDVKDIFETIWQFNFEITRVKPLVGMIS